MQGATDYAYAVSWMCIVWCPVIADRLLLVQCVRVVQLNCVKVHGMLCEWECDVGELFVTVH